MAELPSKPQSYAPTTFTTTHRFTEPTFIMSQECMNRSIVDWEEQYPPENKTVDFTKYTERKDVTLTRSQILLLAEIEDENPVKA